MISIPDFWSSSASFPASVVPSSSTSTNTNLDRTRMISTNECRQGPYRTSLCIGVGIVSSLRPVSTRDEVAPLSDRAVDRPSPGDHGRVKMHSGVVNYQQGITFRTGSDIPGRSCKSVITNSLVVDLAAVTCQSSPSSHAAGRLSPSHHGPTVNNIRITTSYSDAPQREGTF